jgi:Restriction endonuclease
VRSKKAQFLDWLDRQLFESLILDFEVILISGTEATLNCDRVAAESFTMGSLNRYWNYLLQKIDVNQSRGITALLQVADDIAYRLRWTPLQMIRSETRRDRRLGTLLGGRPQMLRRMDGLSPREYEALGCVACQLVGASRIHLTPPGNEGGIDFFALVPLPAQCHLFGPRRGPLRIVGQSKRYEAPVSVGAVRDFITTVENVRKRQPPVESHVPPWFRAARGPLLGFICGHRGFQSGAESLAQDHGIITADSLDLAEAACLSRHLPESANVAERAGILVKMVQEVLSPSSAS